MGFEKMMEDAIIADPRKFLEEKGLIFIARQYHIGKYIFDLMFEDRHGGKLLIELQDGTLDRNHTYKILDYYYEYKEAHPEEFIDLMVIANSIPLERKKRLSDLGITFKEIPKSEFISERIESKEPILPEAEPEEQVENQIPIPLRPKEKEIRGRIEGNVNLLRSYNLFKTQKNLFIKALSEYEPDFKKNWAQDFNDDYAQLKRNWFFMFRPNNWEITKNQSTGVFYAFAYFYDKEKDAEFIRIPLAVQSPMKEQYKDQFKKEVVEALRGRKIDLPECDLYPDAGKFSKNPRLLQIKIPLNDNTWNETLACYKKLKGFNDIVAEKIAEFKRKGYTK